MDSQLKDRGQVPVTESMLDEVPKPEEILIRMRANMAENRILRSLYRIARRIEARDSSVADES